MWKLLYPKLDHYRNKQWMHCMEWIDTRKKWYKWLHINNDIKVQYRYESSFTHIKSFFEQKSFVKASCHSFLLKLFWTRPVRTLIKGYEIIVFVSSQAMGSNRTRRKRLCKASVRTKESVQEPKQSFSSLEKPFYRGIM